VVPVGVVLGLGVALWWAVWGVGRVGGVAVVVVYTQEVAVRNYLQVLAA
jgi:hypothetical protein